MDRVRAVNTEDRLFRSSHRKRLQCTQTNQQASRLYICHLTSFAFDTHCNQFTPSVQSECCVKRLIVCTRALSILNADVTT